MKHSIFYSAIIIIIFSIQNVNAQTINWNTSNDATHIVNLGVAWDYALSYNLGYGYQLKTKLPILLNSSITIPSGKKLLDDFKVKIGGQILLLNQPKLKGGVSINAIYRKYGNPLVKLQNFGSEIKGLFGYFSDKWFVAGELGFDKAIVSHFNHSDIYRDNIFNEVKDGWYQPSTGGNFRYGVETGYSIKKVDLVFCIGSVITENFKSRPLIPYYLALECKYKIK